MVCLGWLDNAQQAVTKVSCRGFFFSYTVNMSKLEKLKVRILFNPNDFNWSELVNLMGQL